MQSTHTSVLNTLVRVQRFLDTNDTTLGTVNQSGYRKVLDDAATALSGHAANQTNSKRAGTAESAKERALRNALKLNHMRPIAVVAAAQLRQAPEFVSLKMPPANSTSRALIAWASSMGTAAAPHAETFTSGGLPSGFLAQLAEAAGALADAIGNRDLTRAQLSAATAGLDSQATRGRQAVKVLNALVEPKLAGDASLLSGWNTAKRFSGRSSPVTNTTIDAAAKGPSLAPSANSSPTPVPAQPAPEPAPAATATEAPAQPK